jgi:hypothetical protein
MMDSASAQERNCAGCKFWSAMIAEWGDRPLQRVCLATGGMYSGQYTTGRTSCEQWQFDKNGPVDHPSRGDVFFEEP